MGDEDVKQVGRITHLLTLVVNGEANQVEEEEAFSGLYSRLHKAARSRMRLRGSNHTLQPTAVMNDAWMTLRSPHKRDIESQSEFIKLATRCMADALSRHDRKKSALKRHGAWFVAGIDDSNGPTLTDPVNAHESDLLDLGEALAELKELNPAAAEIAQAHVLEGLTLEECAGRVEMSGQETKKTWAIARTWLQRRLAPSERDDQRD